MKSHIGTLLLGCMFLALAGATLILAPEHAAAGALPFVGMAGAVVNTKADIVSNLDINYTTGLPNRLNALLVYGGKIREQSGFVGIAAGDSANSVYRFARVRSSWRVASISLLAQANGVGGVMDIGVYNIAANGGAVVSQHLFSTAVSIANAITAPSEVGFGNLNPNTIEMPLWQVLGLSADPGTEYDICGTLTTNGGTAANVGLKVRYTDGAE